MRVLLIGPSDEPLFAEIVASVHAAGDVSHIDTAASLVELDRTQAPDVVLVLQQWPDEYPRQHVLAMIDAYPLARLLVCYGPWCDSDGRTRDHWPHVVRVPLAIAARRFVQELENLRRGARRLPLTADRTEAYPSVADIRSLRSTKPLSIGIVSPDRALIDHLSDVLRAAGHWPHTAGHWPHTAGTDPPDLLLWDADPWDAPSRVELARLLARHPEVPCIGLCGFPRRELTLELQRAVIVAILPKVVENGTLVACLEQTARQIPD
jgi:hypothetical protein